jgi:hypothetical protein
MDPRTSTLESDVAAVHAKIEAIHSNYATSVALLGTEGRLDLKIEASKNELNLKIERTKNELSRDFNKLSVDVRNWVLGTVVGLFVAFGGMVATMYNLMKP